MLRAIIEYGRLVGDRVRRGLPDLPKYGVIRKEQLGGSGDKWFENYRAYDCIFARIFKEYGEGDVGALYCYVDPAKSMAQDPDHKLVHRDCTACGDDFCTFEVLPTIEQERLHFARKHTDWKFVDPRLVKGVQSST